MRFDISDIDWDTDGEEIDLPEGINGIELDYVPERDGDADEFLSEWLSDEYGFCVNGFSYEIDSGEESV